MPRALPQTSRTIFLAEPGQANTARLDHFIAELANTHVLAAEETFPHSSNDWGKGFEIDNYTHSHISNDGHFAPYQCPEDNSNAQPKRVHDKIAEAGMAAREK